MACLHTGVRERTHGRPALRNKNDEN
jgi:hypothetical protein